MSGPQMLSDIAPDRLTYDPSSKPPPFGKAMLKYWAFDENYVNVNHGSYGSLPLPVMAECERLALLAERNTDLFNRITYMPLLDSARKQVSELIGAHHDEVVFVPNTTHGLNTVLRNIEWREGDVILGASTTYGAVAKTIQYLGDRSEQPRPHVHNVLYTHPMDNDTIVEAFQAKIREIKQKHSDRQFTILPDQKNISETGNRFVAVIDALSSMPGVLLPWKRLVKICQEEGIWTIIDAAHAIGQELNINLNEIKPDFWVSNCHKWLYVKRGCAALYTPRRNQAIIKSSIPTSHDYVSPHEATETNFVQQHEWTGTMDLAPFLSVTPALAFRKWLGGEEKINAYCHKLAYDGGKRLAELLGTRLIDESGEQTLSMVTVQMPLPIEKSPGEIYSRALLINIMQFIRDKLFNEWNTYPAYHFHAGGFWCRISAQVWTEMSDFEYVAKALNAICKEVRETILSQPPPASAISGSTSQNALTT